MYNRYVPQGDGSYRRHPVQDRTRPRPVAPPTPCEPEAENPSRHCPPPMGAGSFLKGLLPAGLDTEDLLIVVLLLLMSGEGREDRNLPLLTLALYLFL